MWDSAETGHLHCNTNGAAWEEANGLSDCHTVAKLAKKHTARPLTPLSLTPLTMCCSCLAF